MNILMPNAVYYFNSGMGSTDRMGENINSKRIAIRGKKWWWCIFTWLVDASMQNAWLLWRMRGDELSQKTLKREITTTYLKSFQNQRKGPSRKPLNTLGADNPLFDQRGHLVISVPGNKRRRCIGKGCKSIMKTQCVKCDVSLCIFYFAPYHTL